MHNRGAVIGGALLFSVLTVLAGSVYGQKIIADIPAGIPYQAGAVLEYLWDNATWAFAAVPSTLWNMIPS